MTLACEGSLRLRRCRLSRREALGAAAKGRVGRVIVMNSGRIKYKVSPKKKPRNEAVSASFKIGALAIARAERRLFPGLDDGYESNASIDSIGYPMWDPNQDD